MTARPPAPGRPAQPRPARPPQPRPAAPRPAPSRATTELSTRAEPAAPDAARPRPAGPASARPASIPPRPAVPEQRGGAATSRTTPRATPRTSSALTTTTGRRFPVRPPVVSTGSAARFAERVRARRRLLRRHLYLLCAGVATLLGVAWLLLLSPVLALDPLEVEITGADTVVAVGDVEGVVAERAGTPLPRLDTVRLRDRVLDVPGVREARVTRVWPRGLHVALVAREPVAAVPEAAGGADAGFALLDVEGIKVGRADVAPDGLPVVSVPVGDERTLSAVLTVLQALPPELQAQVAAVSAETRDTVSMVLRDGARVEWGSAQQASLKIAVLTALRAAPASAGASVFDVSAPTLPITR